MNSSLNSAQQTLNKLFASLDRQDAIHRELTEHHAKAMELFQDLSDSVDKLSND